CAASGHGTEVTMTAAVSDPEPGAAETAEEAELTRTARTMLIADLKASENRERPTPVAPVSDARGGELLPGDRLDRYTVIKKLGQGGMGSVYLVRHETLGVFRAAKVLSAELYARGGEFVKRFLQEARLACSISHPNIVNVLDVGEDPGRGLCYIIMEYVDGGTIRNVLRVIPRLGEVHALAVTEAVAEALRAAAEQKIVHRDIKPDNIMLTRRGDVKLADLGIAKNVDEDVQLTRSHVMMGTPAYLAPEQARDARSVDVRADIYSLGATLYEMLTGSIPYPGGSAYDILSKMASSPVPDPRGIVPEISPQTAHLVMRMLAKQMKQRPSGADELLNEIRALNVLPPDFDLRSSIRDLWEQSDAGKYCAPVTATLGNSASARLRRLIRRIPGFSGLDRVHRRIVLLCGGVFAVVVIVAAVVIASSGGAADPAAAKPENAPVQAVPAVQKPVHGERKTVSPPEKSVPAVKTSAAPPEKAVSSVKKTVPPPEKAASSVKKTVPPPEKAADPRKTPVPAVKKPVLPPEKVLPPPEKTTPAVKAPVLPPVPPAPKPVPPAEKTALSEQGAFVVAGVTPAGARARLLRDDGKVLYSKVVPADGRVRFRVVRGEYRLEVSKAGFKPFEHRIRIAGSAQDVSLNVTLVPALCVCVINLSADEALFDFLRRNGAEYRIDNGPWQKITRFPFRAALERRRQVIEMRGKGILPVRQAVEIAPDQTERFMELPVSAVAGTVRLTSTVKGKISIRLAGKWEALPGQITVPPFRETHLVWKRDGGPEMTLRVPPLDPGAEYKAVLVPDRIADEPGKAAIDEADKLLRAGDESACAAKLAEAVKQGSQLAAYRLGVMHEEGRGRWFSSDSDALDCYRKAASPPPGIAAAEYKLGLFYENGRGGLDRDVNKAFEFYKKAAARRDPDASLRMGLACKNGEGGMAVDYRQAVSYLAVAAEANRSEAQYELGFSYENGLGVPINIKLAKFWYDRAAALGNDRARVRAAAFGDLK
ncbi:MAG: protein kinase, partial [Lentisphaeria bacterium]|nr:protein kinase [Lentisphaeria bacterium]